MTKHQRPQWLTRALPYLYATVGIAIIALPDHDASTVTGIILMIVSGVAGILLILLGVVLWANRRRR